MLVNKEVLSALTNALKLGIIPTTPEAIPLLPSVQPVVLVDDKALIGTMYMLSANLNLDIAAGTLVPAYTCPTGKRAYIIVCSMQKTTGESQILVGVVGAGNAALSPRRTAEEFYSEPMGNVWLSAGESIGGSSTDDIADTVINCRTIIVVVDW